MQRSAILPMPVSAQEAVEYVPEHYKDAPGAPRYRIGVATQLERARWERDIEVQGARRVPTDELWAALETFIDEGVLADDQELARQAVAIQRAAENAMNLAVVHAVSENGTDPLTAMTDAVGELVEAGMPEDAEDVPPHFGEMGHGIARAAAARLVQQLQDEARRHSPVYRGLRADHDYWTEVALYCAVRILCRGWSGLSLRCVRSVGQVTEASMRAVPPLDVVFVGSKAIQLATLSPDERKN